jgi:hypothetical protein
MIRIFETFHICNALFRGEGVWKKLNIIHALSHRKSEILCRISVWFQTVFFLMQKIIYHESDKTTNVTFLSKKNKIEVINYTKS